MKIIIRYYSSIVGNYYLKRNFGWIRTMEKNLTEEEKSTTSESAESKKRSLVIDGKDDGDFSEKAIDGEDGSSVETGNKKIKIDEQSIDVESKTSKHQRTRKLDRTGPIVDQPEYYFENGLRKVRPYWFRFTTSAKRRWLGRRLGEVFLEELYVKDPTFFEEQTKLGRITVNGKSTNLDHILKDNDVIRNETHRHEMPILDRPIEIILNNEDVVVVNKPCSFPSHQCGRYYFNSLTYLIKHQYGIDGLRVVHRLDRMTSGMIIFGKTLASTQRLISDISQRNVKKEYLARVVGIFPDDEVICDQPIGSLSTKMGIHGVTTDGKSARTRFTKLFANGNESVVRCVPETGRTHQIRVHLQYLGFPITNDNIYNHDIFGPQKGKGGQIGKSREELCTELNVVFGGAAWIADFDGALSSFQEQRPESSIDAPTARPDLSSQYFDPHCPDCHMTSRDPSPHELEMYLHCLKYEGPNWAYSTPMPKWAVQKSEDDL